MSTILVIDDVDYIRKLVRSQLKKNGYSVILAKDGNEGLEKLNSNSVDLVIMDIVMPEKGGIETLLEMRTHKNMTDVIIITGEIDSKSEALQRLATHFSVKAIIYKPFKKEELLSAVQNAIRA